ncbi:MAG: NAD(P)H-binding protein [Steroidobacteraceae bacterium]
MKVFVCGASGFIGSAICQCLAADGHAVVRGVRTPRLAGDVAIDFTKDVKPEAWTARLAGVDAVVNAVGIIVETRGSRFDEVHHRAPAALFEACARVGVERVVQISALGADGGDTGYFKSKFAADRALMALPLQWTILRPSLVYGEEGDSSRMFRVLASMPIIPVPSLGAAAFQPIHVDDLAEAVSTCLRSDAATGHSVAVVGATSVSYRDMIDTYRRAMGFGAAWYVTVPAFVMAVSAWASGLIPGAPLNPETWRMLKAGSAGDVAGMTELIGHEPKGIAAFIEPNEARRLAANALKEWRPRVLQIAAAIAAILIVYFLVVRRTL